MSADLIRCQTCGHLLGSAAKLERDTRIISDYAAGMTYKDVGKRYGITGQAVREIVRRRAPHLMRVMWVTYNKREQHP